MAAQDSQAEQGGQAGGKYRAEDAPAQPEDKDHIQHNIGKAARHHSQGGQLGRTVVADKAEHQVVGQESGGEEQQYLQIGSGHLKYFLVRPG